ncbi:hypothetical protein TorRG33x02_222620 [Trema orientale]|uniref:Micronuclear linker histone polyprotein-like protein n=1 Tax=Trema orientale TaxID=63057 RepID=A0A2P5E8R9_TREOI|nr:hypothetical protein TorRG33x02_222620 [Trema orientale]
MAVGGSYNKGNGYYGSSSSNERSSGSSNSRSGRPYGLMLLLAFGAALLGVMILHKLRERRIFNLLLKDKDRDLFSLHLLLQKERDYVKEVKRKNEEMKAKIYSLRTQKMELDRRLMEMQSTIDSLKDEQRTMEAAIEEKQNEIKLLRIQQEMNNEKESSQLVALTERLKQKEAEIEDLKHRLQYPEKVWSVSTDDPSKPPLNLTMAEDQKGKTGEDGVKTVVGEDGSLNEIIIGEVNGDDRREMISKETEKYENLQDQNIKEDGIGMGGEKSSDGGQGETSIDGSRDGTDLKVSVENNDVEISSDAISQNGGKDMDGEEFEVKGNGQIGKHGNPHVEDQENTRANEGGMKLEIRDDTGNGVGSRARWKRGTISNSKGKRSRSLAKNRRLENNGKHSRATSARSKRYDEGYQAGSKGQVKKAASGGVLMGDNVKVSESANTESLRVDKEQESQKKLPTSLARETQSNVSRSGRQSEASVEARDQKPEVKFQDQEAIDNRQDSNVRNIRKEVTDDLGDSENFKIKDEQESGKLVGEDEYFSEVGSSAEEKNREYKEENDESQF